MKVWAETGNVGQVIRLFEGEWCPTEPEFATLVRVERSIAVKEIRDQVYTRDGGRCRNCGKIETRRQAHLDEIKSRGDGGEISVKNGQILCAACHILPGGKHDRFPRFTRKGKVS